MSLGDWTNTLMDLNVFHCEMLVCDAGMRLFSCSHCQPDTHQLTKQVANEMHCCYLKALHINNEIFQHVKTPYADPVLYLCQPATALAPGKYRQESHLNASTSACNANHYGALQKA